MLNMYTSRMIKLVNQKSKLKCSLIFDEFPTIYFNNIDSLIATARSLSFAPAQFSLKTTLEPGSTAFSSDNVFFIGIYW